MNAFAEHHRKQRLDPGDAAPRFPDVVVAARLRLGGARRVVGGDEIDLAVDHVLPEPLARRRVADRRCAFERRPDAIDVVRAEEQVVRARLDRDVRAALARTNDRGHGRGARRVHDMDARSCLARGLGEPLDGAPLRGRRPRFEPRCAVAPIHQCAAARSPSRRAPHPRRARRRDGRPPWPPRAPRSASRHRDAGTPELRWDRGMP